jgi:hypothetical protein
MNIYNFCVYLTVYTGNKLPPFYIGSSSCKLVNRGYHGSVASTKYKKLWDDEILNNPASFKTHIISTHTTRDDAYLKEQKLHTLLNVVESPLYVNQMIALSRPDNTGKVLSMQHKQKLSESLKGRIKSDITKLRMSKPKTVEHNKKVSESKLAMIPVKCPHCLVSGNKAVMTRFHFNNCKQNPKYKETDMLTCPHCNKQGRGNMTRYHFDNCKSRKGT